MADTFAISSLHRKRAHLAGEIEVAQKALTRQRDALATLDAVILMFEPDGQPNLIASIRPMSRTCMFFARGELTRLCVAALKDGGKPVATREVADYALRKKGLTVVPAVDRKVNEHVRGALGRLVAKDVIRKVVTWPDVWWELAG